MLVDFHVHSNRSFDGYSKIPEILKAAGKRNLSFVAITDHDEEFAYNSSLEGCWLDPILIPGCEFTTDLGAHIVGLFILSALPRGSTREEVFSHVKSLGGLLIMPHPWKEGSGYMTIYGEDEAIINFNFIELINGGWRAKGYRKRILAIAKNYGLTAIAASDAHKPNQIGLCATKVLGEAKDLESLKLLLKNITQEKVELMVDDSLLAGHGRKVRGFQRLFIYQQLIKVVPYSCRMFLKRLIYSFSRSKDAEEPNLKTVNLVKSPW